MKKTFFMLAIGIGIAVSGFSQVDSANNATTQSDQTGTKKSTKGSNRKGTKPNSRKHSDSSFQRRDVSDTTGFNDLDRSGSSSNGTQAISNDPGSVTTDPNKGAAIKPATKRSNKNSPGKR